MEEWRDVPGFEGKYQISISTKEGKCRSLSFNKTGKVGYMSNKPNRKGRITWTLQKNGVRKLMDASRWVAVTYPELVQNEYFDGAQIDHIDTDRTNNHPTNLRWVTNKENCNNPLTREHNTNSHLGRVFSDETKRKISESQKGKIVSDDTKSKQRESHINNPKQSKMVEQVSKLGETIKVYPSASQAQRETGIDNSSISRCCNGFYSEAGGYKWRYVS